MSNETENVQECPKLGAKSIQRLNQSMAAGLFNLVYLNDHINDSKFTSHIRDVLAALQHLSPDSTLPLGDIPINLRWLNAHINLTLHIREVRRGANPMENRHGDFIFQTRRPTGLGNVEVIVSLHPYENMEDRFLEGQNLCDIMECLHSHRMKFRGKTPSLSSSGMCRNFVSFRKGEEGEPQLAAMLPYTWAIELYPYYQFTANKDAGLDYSNYLGLPCWWKRQGLEAMACVVGNTVTVFYPAGTELNKGWYESTLRSDVMDIQWLEIPEDGRLLDSNPREEETY